MFGGQVAVPERFVVAVQIDDPPANVNFTVWFASGLPDASLSVAEMAPLFSSTTFVLTFSWSRAAVAVRTVLRFTFVVAEAVCPRLSMTVTVALVSTQEVL